ncbi:ABC transporter permease [Terriglobus sp. YAF25]|uniref:ABC transporter permease n=1 Tax=Terriglobus sp. YAF25 TaxID=3233080 RepID=UPI003F9D5962
MLKRLHISATEVALVAALLLECIYFSVAAPSFATWGNFFEIVRFSVELGLLVIALTPILITGGIDLSVGSAIGMTAVLFGTMWHDGHLPAACVGLSLLLGLASGGLNDALLIAGLRLPPLIVTLGTFSLYRGIAEGITHGAVSFTGYSAGFLHLGQGYFWKLIPVQLPILIVVLAAYSVLLHKSVIGRSIYAPPVHSRSRRPEFLCGSVRHSLELYSLHLASWARCSSMLPVIAMVRLPLDIA